VTTRARHLLFVALACLAARSARAQEQPPAPVFSIGQPSRWQLYVDAMFQSGSGSSHDALVVAGTEQSLFNPVVGALAADAEVYGSAGDARADVGARGVLRVPALALGIGVDWNVTRGRGDLLVTYRSAIRRGGLLGNGTMLRVDWLPTRSGTFALGIHVPVAQPLAGRTRPRQVEVRLPARPPRTKEAGQGLPANLEAALQHLDEATRLVGACSSIWSRKQVQVLRGAPPCADASSAYDDSLASAFGSAVGLQAAGTRIAARARAGLLDAVLLPYDTLLGQVKAPADRIDGLTGAAQASFARWLADSSGLPIADQSSARAVHARWLVSVEHVHAALVEQWKDSRFVWLPLQLALAPDQYDEQAEVDALIARAAGRPFTDHNALTYLQGRDLPLEIARSIGAARDYHVLWTHDITSRRHGTHHIDDIGYEMVADAYLPALIAAVRRYDETGRLPVYMIYLDQYFYEPRGGRLWMTMLEDPLHASMSLPANNAEREAHLRDRQRELRAAVSASARLQRDAAHNGRDAWLARTVKVHVNITDPSDFSFRSRHIVPPFPMTPDNLMRDHRKIAFYDLTESEPWRGGMLIMGAGVGAQFATSTWEDRGYRLSGPATLEARAALRRLLRAHGIREADVPAPLREAAPDQEAQWSANAGDHDGRALQVHNEVGWGAKRSSVVRAMLYELVQPGTVVIVPDPQWASPHWAAMLAGAAARGAHVYVVAPSLVNAPTPDKALMTLAHDVLLRLLEIRRDLATPFQVSQGELRVGLFTATAELTDARARRAEVRAGVARAPWLRELFPFTPRALAVLGSSEAHAAGDGENAATLVKDEIPREPKVHQKTQLVARPGAIAALLQQPGWEDALASAIDAQAQETAELTEQLRGGTANVDTASARRADAMLAGFTRGMSEVERRRVTFYFAVGTQNEDPRAMVLDGEAMLLTSGFQGAAGVVDLYYLMARSTWITDATELDRLLPGATWMDRLARWVWPAM
jgi:hypothetical protein